MGWDLALHNAAKAFIFSLLPAEVAELVDAHDSGSCGGSLVEVRVLSSALQIKGLQGLRCWGRTAKYS
jgi:hypothetical protein